MKMGDIEWDVQCCCLEYVVVRRDCLEVSVSEKICGVEVVIRVDFLVFTHQFMHELTVEDDNWFVVCLSTFGEAASQDRDKSVHDDVRQKRRTSHGFDFAATNCFRTDFEGQTHIRRE